MQSDDVIDVEAEVIDDDNVRPLYPDEPAEEPAEEVRRVSGSDVVNEYPRKPSHIPSNLYLLRPGATPKL